VRLLAAAVLFVAGAAAGLLLSGAAAGEPGIRWPVVWLIAVSAAAMLVWTLTTRRSPLVPLAALVFLAGLARAGTAVAPGADLLNVPPGGEVVLEGVLLENPRPAGEFVRLRLRADTLIAGDDRTAAGFDVDVFASRLISADAAAREAERPVLGFQRGDRYVVEGRFTPVRRADSPGKTGAAGVVWGARVTLLGGPLGDGPGRIVAGWRSSLAGAISRVLPEPVASLGTGLLLGDRTRMAPEVVDVFRGSGTAHVLAVSGLHVGMTGMLVLAGAALVLGRRRQAYLLAPLAAIWVYAAMAGFGAPVTRAAIMMSVFLLGRALGRQHSIAPPLGAAAAVMVALQPAVLGEASFHLSFAAVAGIALLGPPFMRWAAEAASRVAPPATMAHSGARWLASGAAICIAATAATAPLVLLYFDALPLWGVPATLAMLPALPALIVSSALGGALGLVSEAVGEIAAWPAWLCGRYVIEAARFFAGLPPGPVGVAGWGPPAAIAYYAVVAGFFGRREIARVAGRARAGLRDVGAWSALAISRGRPVPLWLVAGAAAIAVLAWAGTAALPDGKLRLTIFETEQGDMILVETAGGRQALIDGGATPLGAVRMLGDELPFWDRTLDLVVLTHPHADHVGGLRAVMDRYRVDVVLDVPLEYESGVYEEWLASLPAPGDPTTEAAGEAEAGQVPRRVVAEPGQVIVLDEGVFLEVLSAGWPDPDAPGTDANDASVVMRLRYGDVAVLLAGDLTSEGEMRLLRRRPDVDAEVLKVGHQGSRGSTSRSFLKAVSPLVAVVPAGRENPYGHPHDEALARLRERVCEGCLFVTKDSGDVTVVTDGERLWIETAR